MRFRKFILLFSLWFFLSLICCHSFNYKQHITGDYYLIAVDTKDQISLSLKLPDYGSYIGRIEPKIIQVFYNEKYILAEQQNTKKSIQNYYIIDIEEDGKFRETDDCVFGPMTKSECKLMTDSLNLSVNLKLIKII